RTITGPVRARYLLRRSTSRPRDALRRSSVAAPRCFETASTTDVSRHEHPCRDTTFGDPPPGAVVETADARHRDRPGSAAFPPYVQDSAPDHLAVIRPPTASCLTARCRLRAGRLPTLAPERGWGRGTAAFSAGGGS